MEQFYNYRKNAILYVDDEEKSLKAFSRAFGDQFRILTAPSAMEGYRILEEHKDDIGLLMTDQRMPGEKGVQFLERARQLRPRIVRILATAYSDLDAAVEAVNTGAIYKYVSKPWDVNELEITLRRGLEFFIVQRERDQLLKEKLSVLHNMMITDRVVSLGLLAAGLGHHIRNSLVAVRTFLDLAPAKLQDENVDIDELRNPNFWNDFYHHVQGQLKRITELLADLGLATEGARASGFQLVDFAQVIHATIRRLKPDLEAKSIQVQIDIPASLPRLNLDEKKIHRLFELMLKDEMINLPPGSKIKIGGELRGSAQDGFSEVVITVADNGTGIPQEALRTLFDPFFVRHDNPKEFGINLMACYFIVYHHGGKITVESKDGLGTLFTLSFPAHADPSIPGPNPQEFLTQVLTNQTLWERILNEA